VGEGLLAKLRAATCWEGPLAVVTDAHVGPAYAGRIPGGAVVTIAAGEEHKSLATVASVYAQLLQAGLDRSGAIVALGGGVVGDIAGFVAGTYMRGVEFIQCPTSLLAMVDASVGGKTGVDLPQGKNLVGVFKQPRAVLADLDTLGSLPLAEFSAGMAEVIKGGLIGDPALFESLEAGAVDLTAGERPPAETLRGLIKAAVDIKRLIVEEDPLEHGRRAVLNLGHTFGHAIELVSGFRIRHGEAVAMGLLAAAGLSAELGTCSPTLRPRIERALAWAGLPRRIPAEMRASEIYQAMGSDKKRAAGKWRLVLLRDVGDVFVQSDVPADAVLATLVACGAAAS
jgi:3-dehydroquinate synthase